MVVVVVGIMVLAGVNSIVAHRRCDRDSDGCLTCVGEFYGLVPQWGKIAWEGFDQILRIAEFGLWQERPLLLEDLSGCSLGVDSGSGFSILFLTGNDTYQQR